MMPEIKPKKKFIFYSRLNYMSVILILIGIVIGLFFTFQWRTPYTRATDPVVNYSSLLQTKEKLVKGQEDLKNQIETLNKESSEAQKTLKQYVDSKEKVDEVEKDEVKIGLTEMKGSGVIITLSDANEEATSAKSIAHAADLRDIINFLWGLGAKAISINNERVVFSTPIDCIVNTILINSTKTVPPFEIKVIGDADFIYQSLANENFLKDLHRRADEEGLVFTYEKKDEISIESFRGSVKLDFAKVK
jgi:uncharacterized protein YlxW (UPF0749 family)